MPTLSSSAVVAGAMTRVTRRNRSRPSGPPRMMYVDSRSTLTVCAPVLSLVQPRDRS